MPMRTSRSAIDAMAAAVHGVMARSQCAPRNPAVRSLLEQDLDVIHFRQTWPTAACMLSPPSNSPCAIPMAAWTTIVIAGDEHHVHCDGRLAYVLCRPNDAYLHDLATRALVDRVAAVTRYGTDM